MGTCYSTPPLIEPPIYATDNIEHINPNPSPIPHKPSILSLQSTSATIINSPTNTSLATTNSTYTSQPIITASNLKTLTTNNTIYNAMVTRARNLTNTSNASNSTNYSSIEQLYELTTAPHTFENNPTHTTHKHTDTITPKPSIHETEPLKSNTDRDTILTIPKNTINAQTHTIPSICISALSKLPTQHLPIPTNASKSKSDLSKRTSNSQSHNTMLFISSTPPPELDNSTNASYPTTPSPLLHSQHSGQSLQSFSLTQGTLSTNTTNNFNFTLPNEMTVMEQLHERNESNSDACLCMDISNNCLDIDTFPSRWNLDCDYMLRYILKDIYMIPIALFDLFKSYIIDMNAPHILCNKNGKYHKRIRNELQLQSFCPCWYHLFDDIPLKVMQFGYCPGTTQFALKFTRNGSDDSGDAHKMERVTSFEERSRFKSSINIGGNNGEIDIEIFDMNIAEFPTMIPSYLESYEPHVILLLFDVADRSSFDGIIKMRKSLENLYESLSEKCEYDLSINPRNSNLKRFHESFDALTSVFRFGNNSSENKTETKHVKTRSNSVASILSNLSFGISSKSNRNMKKSKSIDICDKHTSLKKRSRTYSNLNKFSKKSNNISVNESNKNEFTIQPLSEEKNKEKECMHCYYHNSENINNNNMPPILVIGIQADIDNKDRNVSIEEGLELSKKWEVPYIEASAMNGNNVNDVFLECIRTRWLYDTFPNVRFRSRAFLIT